MVMIQGESLGQRAGILPPPHDELVLVDRPDADDTDNMLLARLRAGDERAFGALVDRHRPWLVRHCTRLLGHDSHAAEDAAQESLLKLHAAALRGQPLRVRPWLSVVARNTCVDEQRRRRPDLPGELPERAVAGDDPFELDAALADAWSHLAGRHREVLYLREVLGFSYKEIGAVMGLSMAATETLVFRARGALKREYERSGGTSFGSALLGLQLARFSLDRRREAGMAESAANAAASDPGFSTMAARFAHFLSTSLPGCGEQAVAKVLTLAAGVVMAAATVIPGLNPFADRPAGAGAGGSAVVAAPSAFRAEAPDGPVTLKALLGNGVPESWTPQRSRTESKTAPPPGAGATPSPRVAPLRDAAEAFRTPDRPTLNRPVRGDSEAGPLRSILADRPGRVESPERPTPLRSLLEAMPTLVDPLPVEALPIDALPIDTAPMDAGPSDPPPGSSVPSDPPLGATPGETGPGPDQGSRPTIRDTAGAAKDTLPPGDGNVADRDGLLRRRNG